VRTPPPIAPRRPAHDFPNPPLPGAQELGTGNDGTGPTPRRIIRVMPNTPCEVGVGASAMAGNSAATHADWAAARAVFNAVGTSVVVREPQLDGAWDEGTESAHRARLARVDLRAAVTGLSGSGPAFVAMFVEALADGGVLAGLPRDVAMALALQTVGRAPAFPPRHRCWVRSRPRTHAHAFPQAQVKGTATLLETAALHPGVLKDRVASPGGTTIAGIHALESGGMRGAVMGAVAAASRRATELGAPAPGSVGGR
jgi:pyrroline-5-carboxylate reductase